MSFRSARHCGTKARHKSRLAANRAAEALRAQTDESFQVYKCRECEFFHVGHSMSIEAMQHLARQLRGLT